MMQFTVHVLVPAYVMNPDTGRMVLDSKALCNGQSGLGGCYTADRVRRFGDRACQACLDKAAA